MIAAGAHAEVSGDEPRAAETLSIVFGGDVMLDGGPGHAIMNGKDPFSDFESLLKGADFAVCNLECTVATSSKQRADKSYLFFSRPRGLEPVKRYFTAVSVANNHALDYGRKAFVEELELLDEAGIGHFGGGRNRREAHRPLLLERKGLRVALLAYNDIPPRSFAAGMFRPGVAWMDEGKMVSDITKAHTAGRADIVIPFLHWGSEMEPLPKTEQQALARRLIDAGASAVIGGHPHVTQTVEVYRGRPIIYSLGNFVFDYFPVDPPIWTGWLAKLTFSRDGNVDFGIVRFEIDPAGIPHPIP